LKHQVKQAQEAAEEVVYVKMKHIR
jgi:hypothetical protein